MKKAQDTTLPSTRQSKVFGLESAVPGLLVAHAPANAVATDRVALSLPFAVGRADDCGLPVNDQKMSKRHFRIAKDNAGFWVEDMGSTNGTFVQGAPVSGTAPLPNQGVIRAGGSVFVFCHDAETMLRPPPAERFGLAGRFHVSALIQQMREAAESSRHVLLSGPSGSGKELTARGLATLMGHPGPPLPFLTHNAARFSSEEEATSTLFGVGARVFSNVSARPGLIEEAEDGVLFLDEVHNLPERVQRSLLRVIEDGRFARIGETKLKKATVRFVLASNMPPPDHGLAHDLLARLRVASVPPLRDRIADIPSIFNQLLKQAAKSKSFSSDQVFSSLSADHYEALCLDRFETANVRGLTDLVDRLVSRIATGVEPARAVATLFAERFQSNPVNNRQKSTTHVVSPAAPPMSASPAATPSKAQSDETNSHYERHRDEIISAYRECGGNLSAVERLLLSRDIRCSRRWLRFFVKKWGLRS